MNTQKAVWLLLCIMSSTVSQFTMAKSPVANTPVNQGDYEPIHQGILYVNASIFNAPCNLRVKDRVMLTNCGAGAIFREAELVNAAANTPAMLQFYDVNHKSSVMSYPLSLANGDNPVNLPLSIESQRLLRLEVSYE